MIATGRVGLALALVLAAGCFSDGPTGGGARGTTGGDDCPIATLGCPCDGERCDEDLACEPSVSRCIDPTCTPGQLLCTCVDGLCLEGLECDGALCQPPVGGTSTSTSTTTATTGGPSSDSTEDEVTGMSASTATTTPDDVGTPECSEMPCAACRQCVVAPGGTCSVAFDTCEGVCAAVANCTLACDAQISCVSECCDDYGDGMNLEYNGTIANCVEMACTGCAPDLTCPA